MRIKSRLLFTVVCLVVVLLGVSASALAAWSWCPGGCPPGLIKNGNEKPYEATDGKLYNVHQKQGNTEHTAGHNPHAPEG